VRAAVGAAAARLLLHLLVVLVLGAPGILFAATPIPEPSPAVGRVVYRAAKVASFESLGVTMIACRHRDPGPRMITIEFYATNGTRVPVFGPTGLQRWEPGKKLLFVSDPTYFHKRDVVDMRVGHLAAGTARIVSDARILHCRGQIRFDPGAGRPSYMRSIGLYRVSPGATPPSVEWWEGAPTATPEPSPSRVAR
jgi:hypothetical protein